MGNIGKVWQPATTNISDIKTCTITDRGYLTICFSVKTETDTVYLSPELYQKQPVVLEVQHTVRCRQRHQSDQKIQGTP